MLDVGLDGAVLDVGLVDGLMSVILNMENINHEYVKANMDLAQNLHTNFAKCISYKIKVK